MNEEDKKDFYRGGSSFQAKPNEVRIDPETGYVKPTHGISVHLDSDRIRRFGGAYKITSLPETLKLIFKYGWDERDDLETPMKGCRNDGIVKDPNGQSYSVYFIDPDRLQQDLEEEIELGSPFLAFPGLIIVPEVTKKVMEEAVIKLWKQGYFNTLKPLEEESVRVA